MPHLIRMSAVIPMKREAGGGAIWEKFVGNLREMLFVVVPEEKLYIEARKRASELALGAIRIATRFPDLGGARLVLRRKIVDFYSFSSISIEPFTEVIGIALVTPRFQKAPVALHRRPFQALWRRPRRCDDFKPLTL